ncbi:MAG TPA: phosphopantothenoylcysteine decarboxylase [Enhygromyxa sp.]|nr:phosphopantothenoylcysteine decarboxylase [Enhygromyxa sp.]
MADPKRFYVLTGGTMVHVAPHFSLCAPAYGRVGVDIHAELARQLRRDPEREVVLIRTKMAIGAGAPSEQERALFKHAELPYLETNDDLAKLLAHLVARPDTACIVLACAVCDWQPESLAQAGEPLDVDGFGKQVARLETRKGPLQATLRPADKLIASIRQQRKDVFLVGFKATTGLSEDALYLTGLGLLKRASCNLVLANDVHTRLNMVITPEEARYHVSKDRREVVAGLCEMIELRTGLTFTRSTVVPGEPIPWTGDEVPANLRAVVDHCIARGAYKPFQGKTVGHFATRGPRPGIIYTSRRKSNFNNLATDGLLEIEAVDQDRVIARGAKPSVGGQSQRIIFDMHEDVDCIVHFHCPPRHPIGEDAGAGRAIPTRPQRPFECGSHECGRNTAEGLREVWQGIKAVYLDEHGPNICFSRHEDPRRVIEFIEHNFDLEAKTGGLVG